MRKISLFLQEILKILLVFLLSFVWLRYFFKKLWLAVLLGALLCAVIYAIWFLLRRRKNSKLGLKLKEKEDAENMFLSLACEDKPINFFAELASKKHENITKHKNHLVIKHPDGKVTVLYADMCFEGLNIPRFMEIYNKVKKEKGTKIVICCKEIIDKNLLSFCASFKEHFLFLDLYETYQKLYKYYDIFPKITQKFQNEKKLTIKDFAAYSFNKKRTKGYLFSAVILIFCSLFVRATLYYCIVASLLVVFAIISQFNPRFNPKTNNEIL